MFITRNTNKVVAGVTAFIAGLFMLGGMVVLPVQAQETNQQLRQQVQMLLETIANLQRQLTGRPASASVGSRSCSAVMLNTNLSLGNSSTAVRDLQRFLNADPDTRVAASGPGAPGQETVYFGPRTAQAVSAFQTKYASNVLFPLGLNRATGFWGNSSRSQARLLCAQRDQDQDRDQDRDRDRDQDRDQADRDDLRGGEASLEDYDMSRGEDQNVEEGETGEVAEFEFDVEDGDVRLSRVDISFVHTGNDGDDEPWDVFEEITLMYDGDEIASKDISDEDDWLDDGSDYSGGLSGDEQFTVRLASLDTIIREGDTAEFVIELEVAGSVDDADQDVSWGIFIDDDGIRAIDSEGINNYIGNDSDTVEFDIEGEGSDEELTVRSSSDDPSASLIQTDRNSRSDEYGIFAFDLEAKDNDIDLETMQLRVSFSGEVDGDPNNSAEYDDVVSDAYVEIDGDQFDVDDVDSTSTGDDSSYADLTFDIDKDYTLDADDEVTVVLFLEFNAQNSNYEEGTQVRGSIQDGWIEGEGADDVESDGAVTGEWHTLRVSGTFTDGNSNTDADSQDGIGTFEIEVDLTAFEEDAYISDDVDTAFNYSVIGPSSDAGTTNAIMDSSASDRGTHYRIDEGSTETFTITITHDPTVSGSYYAVLESVHFSQENDGTFTDSTYNFSPRSDFRTRAVSISGSAS